MWYAHCSHVPFCQYILYAYRKRFLTCYTDVLCTVLISFTESTYMLLSSAVCAIEMSLKRAHWSYISFTLLSVVALPINDGLQLPWQGLHEVHRVLQHLGPWGSVISHTKQFQNVIFYTHICFYWFLGLITLHMNNFFYLINCHVWVCTLWCSNLKSLPEKKMFYLGWRILVRTCDRHIETQREQLYVTVIYRDTVTVF